MKSTSVRSRRSPTVGLLAGLAITLSAVAVYSGYTILQLRTLRRLQAETIDRNRMDSLLLLRIQNNLNLLGLTMRDMLDASEPYPLTAWQGQLKRIRFDLEDALAREEKVAAGDAAQRRYLGTSVAQFWDAADRILALAQEGQEQEARTRIRLSLEARQATLSTVVARLLVQNNENEQQAAAQAQAIYARVERNVYLFLTAMLVLVAATSLYLVNYNRRLFDQVADLSERRSELARQLISIQENTFRYISRELHDDFGQILTAIGAMLQRAHRRASAADAPIRADVEELREIVQSTLEKVRTLSQALHPVVLDDAGLEGALNLYLPGFEKQTGIEIDYQKDGPSRPVDRDVAIHLYRVLQEALNNVARHSKSAHASVRLHYHADSLVLEVEDRGVGFNKHGESQGMGLTSMRERSELINGRLDFLEGSTGGVLVRLTVPLEEEKTHAGA
jgi:signal transduction histidine kinase